MPPSYGEPSARPTGEGTGMEMKGKEYQEIVI